ncbi:hypothetical protein [Aureispira anguillae]|uniref:Uncharacterized protein n=1 Tax=Aureispira anguillae TaxID=2864201 RepID=A0A915YDW1_9BACT|nr:hypothetical protein [Aureispira anguillae]BDS11250.1 hypothetical protein AsAng_0019620 [Aureispira anguillae]
MKSFFGSLKHEYLLEKPLKEIIPNLELLIKGTDKFEGKLEEITEKNNPTQKIYKLSLFSEDTFRYRQSISHSHKYTCDGIIVNENNFTRIVINIYSHDQLEFANILAFIFILLFSIISFLNRINPFLSIKSNNFEFTLIFAFVLNCLSIRQAFLYKKQGLKDVDELIGNLKSKNHCNQL